VKQSILSALISVPCLVGSEGGAAIAIGFLHLAHLQRLELDYNEIGEDGVEHAPQVHPVILVALPLQSLMTSKGPVTVSRSFWRGSQVEYRSQSH